MKMRNKTRNKMWNMAVGASLLAGMGLAAGRAQAQGGGMAPPFAGGGMKSMTVEEAMKVAPQQDKSLAPLAKAADTAEAKLKKAPKDPAAKKAYVEAEYKFGFAAEHQSALPPKIMYRAALGAYRKALAVDPKHQPSLNEKKQIEDIYKTMNMEVPAK